MEITIKLKTPKELEKIRKILKGEKIKVMVVDDKKTKREARKLYVPNEETIKTFEKTDIGEELIRCSSIEDFFKKLGI